MEELTLEEIKEKQLSILDYVHDFCINNNIRYSLAGGTLLGAVRHKGYIPWDDDIDIMMLRTEYEKFIELFASDLNTSKFRVVSCGNTDDYSYPLVKVEDSSTSIVEKDISYTYTLGINIDLFPIDNLPVIKLERKIKVHLLSALRRILSYSLFYLSSEKTWIKIVKFPFRILINKRGRNYLASLIDQLAKSSKSSKTVGCLVWGPYLKKEIHQASIFCEYSVIDFEGRKYTCIKNYDSYLKNIYTDYLSLPPIDKRVRHHNFVAYLLSE